MWTTTDQAYRQQLLTAEPPELRKQLSRQRMWFWVGVARAIILALVTVVAVGSLLAGHPSAYGWIFGLGGLVGLYLFTRSLNGTRRRIRSIRAQLDRSDPTRVR